MSKKPNPFAKKSAAAPADQAPMPPAKKAPPFGKKAAAKKAPPPALRGGLKGTY